MWWHCQTGWQHFRQPASAVPNQRAQFARDGQMKEKLISFANISTGRREEEAFFSWEHIFCLSYEINNILLKEVHQFQEGWNRNIFELVKFSLNEILPAMHGLWVIKHFQVIDWIWECYRWLVRRNSSKYFNPRATCWYYEANALTMLFKMM